MSQDDLATEALLTFLDAIEAGVASAKYVIGQRKGVGAKVKEVAFTILKWEGQKGAKIGAYEVAYLNANLPEKWRHGYNILRQSNAVINSRYSGEGYQCSYWLYGEGKIYRQLLKS